jgi:hypothetical protein
LCGAVYFERSLDAGWIGLAVLIDRTQAPALDFGVDAFCRRAALAACAGRVEWYFGAVDRGYWPAAVAEWQREARQAVLCGVDLQLLACPLGQQCHELVECFGSHLPCLSRLPVAG